MTLNWVFRVNGTLKNNYLFYLIMIKCYVSIHKNNERADMFLQWD